METDCVFCKMVSGKIPVKKIYENSNFFSIHDANPITKGHSLVISKKHFENTVDLPEVLGLDLLDCIKKTAMEVLKATKAEGFNVVNNNFATAGQIVNHCHYHIIPRKEEDGLRMFCKE